jgi:hypothetical protein
MKSYSRSTAGGRAADADEATEYPLHLAMDCSVSGEEMARVRNQ